MEKYKDGLSEQEQIVLLALADDDVPTRKYSQPQNVAYDPYVAKLLKEVAKKDSGSITGTFTGETIGTTMPVRNGRKILAPGPRIFDGAQLLDIDMENYKEKLRKLNELIK